MTAEELLMSDEIEVFQYSNVIEIDGQSRVISVPLGEDMFGVEGDKNVTLKHFTCPKIVGNNIEIDLSEHNLYANYTLADEKGNPKSEDVIQSPCENIVIGDDNITFDWKISEWVTREDGFIAFSIVAKKSVDGLLETRWYTTPAVGKIRKTVKEGRYLEQQYPDVIDNLMNRVSDLERILANGEGTGGSITVDSALSETSTNPVQNKVVTKEIRQLSKEIVDIKSNNKKNGFSTFVENTDVDYAYDNATGAYYTVIRVYRDKLDGTKQYPFVLFPNDGVGKSTKELNLVDGWYLAINGGIFNSATSPDGIVIENGVVLKNEPTTSHPNCKPLTIDANGTLGYAEADADANELVANGIVSAVAGFMPIILDYEAVPSSEWNDVTHYTQNAQRQIIGQWGCGDYAIITCEGRSSHNSDGWTMEEAQQVCIKHGLKFAYNLDGGGSTETMLGYKHINTIYDNIYGRKVPTFIVFNGKDYFKKPSEGDIDPAPEIETYTSLEYITFTGEQYIDTGVADKEMLGAESEFMIPEYLSGGKHILSSTNTYFGVITQTSWLTFKRCGSSEVNSGKQVVYTNERHLVSAFVNSDNTYIDSTLLNENVTAGATKSGNLYIGAYGGRPATATYRFKGNVYRIKIYDGTEIVRDYVPAMNKAGIAGLLDVVENKFYTSGTDVQCVAGTVLN